MLVPKQDPRQRFSSLASAKLYPWVLAALSGGDETQAIGPSLPQLALVTLGNLLTHLSLSILVREMGGVPSLWG